jgi:membrane protease YdiL (CAAX protease family)
VRPPLDLKLLLALPGLFLGALGLALSSALAVPLRGLPLELLVPAALTAYWGVLALAHGFEQLFGSFRDAGGMLEEAVRRLGLTPAWALALGATSAVGEELFFRGFLLGLLARLLGPVPAVLLQAAAFAALHPAPRRAWAYPLWTLLVGLLLGSVALGTGSVLPGLLAHYVFNHENFNAALEMPRPPGRRG